MLRGRYSMSPMEKFVEAIINFPKVLGNGIVSFFKAIGHGIASFFKAIANFFMIIIRGDFRTKLTFIIMGFGSFTRKQFIRGLIFLGIQVGYIYYMISFGWGYLQNITTLGTATRKKVWNAELEIFEYIQGDNSMKILLFGVVTIVITLAFLFIYVSSIKSSYKAQLDRKAGKKLPTFKEDVVSLLDSRFHISMLSIPTIMVVAFTILPIIFMICIAFTNFDKAHQPPANLFTWVGFDNFNEMFLDDPLQTSTLWKVFSWTMIWAVFATLTNYIFGMILAMIINRKGIKCKSMWRTIFVITIAVPQFVTLLLMSKIFADQGPLNAMLMNLGLITENIPFLTNPALAKVVIILVNMWVGIPHTMLITTGILLNIPEEMYESAKIDGAKPFKMFTKITLPYMLFVTTPYLITQFVGNINNFNVIFLLTGGGPVSLDYYQAGQTDLLVTWLYKLTVNEQNYNVASTIGIFVFVVTAVLSLFAYNMSSSTRKEDQFQ